MKKHKIDSLLGALQADERKGFIKFLDSCYFNTNTSLLALFKALCHVHPDGFGKGACNWQAAFRRAFPKREFNDHTLENVRLKLRRLLEDFFVLKEAFRKSNANHHQWENLLSKALARRNAFKPFVAETAGLIDKIETLPQKDANDYLGLQQFYHRLLEHPLSDKFKPGLANIKGALDNLDAFYVLTKLEYAADIANRKKIFEETPPVIRLWEAVDHLVKTDRTLPAIAKIRLEVYQLHSAADAVPTYRQLKAWLLQDVVAPTVNFRQWQEVFFHLVNFAIRQTDKAPGFQREQFELFKLGSKHELMLENGILSDIAFTNAVVAGAAAQEITWVETFIDTHQHLLDKKIRAAAIFFANAHLLFHRSEHAVLEAQFKHAPPMPFSYDFRLHLLRIRSYYESIRQGKMVHQNLENVCFTYAHRMKSNKDFIAEKKKAYGNFISYLRQLIHHQTNSPKLKALQQAVVQHSNDQELILKSWLTEKIEEAINTATESP